MIAVDDIKLTDTHCHLNYIDSRLVGEKISTATDNGVKRIVTIGTDYNKSLSAVNIAKKYDNIFATVGVHPSDSESYSSSDYDKFKELASRDKVIAIGEVGLDFYRDSSPRTVQERVFVEFINLSLELKKPLIIHNRESSTRLIEILSSELATESYSGIIHCFSGDREIMDWAIKSGFYISIAGQSTYKSAENIRNCIKDIPLDRLLIETDAPYLTPIPMRGKVDNEPAFVRYTFELVANILDIDRYALAEKLDRNFATLFRMKGLYDD